MKEASSKQLVKNSFPLRSSRNASPQQIEVRVAVLGEIIERARIKKEIIDENYLLLHMRLAGYQNYTRNILYKDKLALDADNSYLRNFLPRYSKFQEEILDEINDLQQQAVELAGRDWGIKRTIVRETKDGKFETTITEEDNYRPKVEFMKIRAKVLEIKQKHGDGNNIQISAVIIQKELKNKREEIVKLQQENKILTVTPNAIIKK